MLEDLFGFGDAATVYKIDEVKGKMREYKIEVGEGEKKAKKSLDGPLSRLSQCVEKLSLPLDKALFELYVKGCEDHWNLRTKDSYKHRCDIKQKVHFCLYCVMFMYLHLFVFIFSSSSTIKRCCSNIILSLLPNSCSNSFLMFVLSFEPPYFILLMVNSSLFYPTI